jgi:predicted nucleic acid-binding Zn finger protein
MKELDQQYEGGTAPCLPSTSFRSNERDTHRADKGPEDNTRPCGRRRTNHSANYNVSLQKAKEPNRFKIIDVEQYSPSQACITIKTSDGKFYSIHFDKSTTCSCPFSDIQIHIRQGKVPCKHRLFVLMAIEFSEEDEIVLQYIAR